MHAQPHDLRRVKIHNLRLQTTQGHHPDKHGVLIFDGCQQLAVKEAENVAEELPLDWVSVDLCRVSPCKDRTKMHRPCSG